MARNDDKSPLVTELGQYGRDPVGGIVVNACERFVGDQDVWVRRNCPGEGDPTQGAGRQASASAVGGRGNPESVEKGEHQGRVRAGEPRRQRQILEGGQIRVQVTGVPDEGRDRPGTHFAGDRDAAGRWRGEARQQSEERRLAGPVRSAYEQELT